MRKLRGQSINVVIRADGGCGAIRRKGERWVSDLVSKGCSAVIIVHDLDRDQQTGQLRDEAALRTRLEKLQAPRGTARYVCIPVEELEAWFWADQKVLGQVARGSAKAHPRPETLARPKEALMRLSRDEGKKPLYSTNENPKLAEELDLDLCAQRCPSFYRLRQFVVGL